MKPGNLFTLFASYIFNFSGLVYLHRARNTKARRVPILTYHSIAENNNRREAISCLDAAGMVVPRTLFQKQVEFVKRNFTVVGLDDLYAHFHQNKSLPEKPTVLTFDDGFKDNITHAYPVLKRLGCRATFFIIGNCLNGEKVWLHELYRILDAGEGKSFRVAIGGTALCDTGFLSFKEKMHVAVQLKKVLSRLNPKERWDILKGICDDNGIAEDAPGLSEMYMSVEDLKTLAEEGNLLGGHSVNHDRLTGLSDSRLNQEITDSKALIEMVQSRKFVPFAYPHGTGDSFNEKVKDVLRRNGFSCAVTTIEGLNDRRTDPYALRRIEIGRFERIQFKAHMNGTIGEAKLLLKKLAGNRKG